MLLHPSHVFGHVFRFSGLRLSQENFKKEIHQKLPDILGEDTKQKQRIFRVVRRKLPRSREEDRGSFPLFVCLLA